MNAARKRCRLCAGLVVAASLGVLALAAPALANQPVDPVTTGSIGNDGGTLRSDQGSAAFRKALEILASGDQAGAYAMAKGLPNDIERRTIQWAAIYFGNGAIDHGSVLNFEADAPEYASAALYHTRLEQALVKENASDDQVIRLLGGQMPNTTDAQIALALAYKDNGQAARAARIARSIWVDNFLDRASEDKVRLKLGDLLTRRDHWDRIVHLLMNDRASGTERMLGLVSPAQKSLAQAGIAVARGGADARRLLDRVDPSLRTSALFYFLAAQQARAEGRYSTAVANLDAAKGPLPDAAQWWYERRTLLRQLLMTGDVKLAYRTAAGYTHGPDGRLVEAHFHAGWIALSFLKDPATAQTHFEAMRKLATLPDTVTQANYWLGRSLLAVGDKAGATTAFQKAAGYSTTYYGLLARAELGLKGAELRPMPAWQASVAAFDSHELTKAIRLLAANGQAQMAAPLLSRLAGTLKDGGELVLAARLAQDLDAHHLAISIADMAAQRGTPLDLFSFPKDGVPSDARLASIDKAAIYAVARQESRFKIDAVSSSGARGIMQLMPATAKETAQKMGLSYSPNKLVSDPAYNLQIGSTYLASQLDRFDGSLVLAAAAYNAGGGNAAKWIAAFGDPRAPNVDPILWVELIPFEETRNYVRRVLANYVVYRQRLGGAPITITEALKRIAG